MHTKPDLRVNLKWMITGSGSVITDVIRLNKMQFRIRHILAVTLIFAFVAVCINLLSKETVLIRITKIREIHDRERLELDLMIEKTTSDSRYETCVVAHRSFNKLLNLGLSIPTSTLSEDSIVVRINSRQISNSSNLARLLELHFEKISIRSEHHANGEIVLHSTPSWH